MRFRRMEVTLGQAAKMWKAPSGTPAGTPPEAGCKTPASFALTPEKPPPSSRSSSGLCVWATIDLKARAFFTKGSLTRFFSRAMLKKPALVSSWVVTRLSGVGIA